MKIFKKKEKKHKKNERLDEEIIESVANEVVFGEAISKYLDIIDSPGREKKKEEIVKRFPKDKQREILADFTMIDLMQEMGKEEGGGLLEKL